MQCSKCPPSSVTPAISIPKEAFKAGNIINISSTKGVTVTPVKALDNVGEERYFKDIVVQRPPPVDVVGRWERRIADAKKNNQELASRQVVEDCFNDLSTHARLLERRAFEWERAFKEEALECEQTKDERDLAQRQLAKAKEGLESLAKDIAFNQDYAANDPRSIEPSQSAMEAQTTLREIEGMK